MLNNEKGRILVLGAIGTLLLGACIYFVTGITAVSPPIKMYPYKKSITRLKDDLKKIAISNNNVSYRFKDVAGDANVGYKYHISLSIKDTGRDLEYHFIYDKTDYWFKENLTQIRVIMAYDETNQLGAFSSSALGVSNPIQVLERDVINKLSK